MQGRRSRRFRRCAALVAVTLLAGCGGSVSSGPPATIAPASPQTGASPGATPGPAASPGASQASDLPAPTITDPTAIGAALWDAASVEQGVVSLVEQLGIDIYSADGALVRDAAAAGPPGMWLFEAEVRGLIEMGKADAAAIAAHEPSPTLADLSAGFAAVWPSLTFEAVLEAYVEAYRAAPGDLVRESLAGHAFVPAGEFTRVHLWLIVLDGVLGRPQPATASTVAFSRGLTAAAPVASVQLPAPAPGLAQLMSIDLTNLPIALAHMGVVAHMLPVDFRISPSTVHEGHGGSGQPATLVFKSSFVAAPIFSPVTGLPILMSNNSGLAGLPVTFQTPQQAILRAHGAFSGGIGAPGTLPGSLGIPAHTDVLGEVRFDYTPIVEQADGAGDLKADVAVISAVVDLQQVVLYMYAAGGAAALAPGVRIMPVPLVIEWHEELPAGPGAWEVDLTGPKDGAGHYSGTADSICTHQPGSPYWTAVAQPVGAGITMIDLSSSPDRDFVNVSARQTSDFSGLWGFASDSPNTFAEVVGDESGASPVVRGTARYTDTEGRVYTAAVTIVCAQTF